MRHLLSLFDYTGNWSRPYLEAGWEITRIDIRFGLDVFRVDPAELAPVNGILAAPPCTDFAVSGARWFADKDRDGTTFRSIALMYQTISIIWYLRERDRPAFWCLENPVGRLNRLVPQLQLYGPRYFQPCDYGDPYTKKTGLWGEFIMPYIPEMAVEPTEGSRMWKLPPSPERAALRSATPEGFARAFYEANHG